MREATVDRRRALFDEAVEMIEREPERFAVEVATGENFAGIGQDGGVVDRRAQLSLQHRADIGERIAIRTVNLWDASQRVRVLNQVLGFAMRCDYPRTIEKAAQVLSDLDRTEVFP